MLKLPHIKGACQFLFQNTRFHFNDFNHAFDQNGEDLGNENFLTGTCLLFSRKIFISSTGKILPCERIDHKHSLGYVDEHDVSIDFGNIAEKYNYYFEKISGQCKNCYMRDNCSYCIFTLNINDNINWICPYFTTFEKYLKYLSFNTSILEQNPELYNNILTKVVLQ